VSDTPDLSRASVQAWELLNKTLEAYEKRCEQKHFAKDRRERKAAAKVYRLKGNIPEPTHPDYVEAFRAAFVALRDYCRAYATPRLDDWSLPKKR